MDGLPEYISLNGPDNVGKTTQLRRLAEMSPRFQPLGSVHEHDSETWHRVAGEGYARWWFETSTTAELTRMLISGHTKRATAKAVGRAGLLDRGRPMLLAVAAATCALKDGLTVPAALDRVTVLAEQPSPDETSVLLLPSRDPDRSYAITSARENRPWTGVYPAYQRLLHQVLLLQAERGTYPVVVLCEGRSAADIHAAVAGHLSSYLPTSQRAERNSP
ncbi:hypothetical protein [Streptomyces sp. NBC_01803]|uniref:hypothetical protein n=1 Tax=Streptomyces sp. NBC_01803 TaxID=2975946 RepID=UPI002DD9B43D|nr:hypothetical protein [Streptomyces sp. NBC_01803]WSA45125.1 hypothetical protein OIE51_13465 [Streptomyces sp. NBC_01803]